MSTLKEVAKEVDYNLKPTEEQELQKEYFPHSRDATSRFFGKNNKVLKVAIIGADGRKWTKKQKLKVKKWIYNLLAYGIEGNINRFTEWERENIIVLSGHCPVGKERYWCYELERFVDEPNDYAGKGYQFSPKVFDQGGVDTWAEIIATKLGIKTEIYPAPAKAWLDKRVVPAEVKFFPTSTATLTLDGYRSRNLKIANVCNIIYDIEPAGSCKRCNGTGKRHFGKESMSVNCQYCEGDGSYSGGTFTYKEARKRRKEVHKVIIE